MPRSTPALVLFITLVYLSLAVLNAMTMRPWCDEGWFANPAENLVTTGSMATSVLDPTSTWRGVHLQGIDRHTYWVMPLYLLAQAGWYHIVGFSMVSTRLSSVLWGLVVLVSWYVILKRLSGNTAIALLAAGLLGIDFQFLATAGDGRMDMMTAALESGALAAYLTLRERHLGRAILVSQTLAAAGVFTHPLGILGVAGLAFVTCYYDRSRLRFRYFPLAGLPYLLGMAGWALYIMQSPTDFRMQYTSNASGRFELFQAPLTVLHREIALRYMSAYGLAAGTPAPSRLKGFVLAIYVVGILAACIDKRIRKHHDLRLLLVLVVGNLVGLTILDSFGIGWYLIYLLPLAAALLATLATYWWSSGRARVAVALTLGLLIAIQVTVSISRIVKNDRGDFLAATGFLRDHLSGYQLVMASAEFGIPIQFDRRLIDDFRLGYLSRKQPDLIVMDTPRYCLWTELLRNQDAENYGYIRKLLSTYRVVYDYGSYRMYERVRP